MAQENVEIVQRLIRAFKDRDDEGVAGSERVLRRVLATQARHSWASKWF